MRFVRRVPPILPAFSVAPTIGTDHGVKTGSRGWRATHSTSLAGSARTGLVAMGVRVDIADLRRAIWRS
jgi:hypothetical protein